jgi:hypothetical protein
MANIRESTNLQIDKQLQHRQQLTLNEDNTQKVHLPRTDNNRFCDTKRTMQISIVACDNEEVENNDRLPPVDLWLETYATAKELKEVKQQIASIKKLSQSRVIKYIVKLTGGGGYNKKKAKKNLKKILLENVTEDHEQFKKCITLVERAFKEDRVELLLQLYTLDTPFYRALLDDPEPLIVPLLYSLHKL